MHYSIFLFIAILMAALGCGLLFIIFPPPMIPNNSTLNPPRNAAQHDPIAEPVINNRQVLETPKKKKKKQTKRNEPTRQINKRKGKGKSNKRADKHKHTVRKQWKTAGRTRR
jgi:hypothetical protein